MITDDVVTLGNKSGLETVTVKRDGTFPECVGKEPDIAGPSGVGVEVYRQMVVRGGRYKKHRRRWTNWNSPGPKGVKYGNVGPMPLKMTSYESSERPHGVRLPVVTLDSIPATRRDVNLVSTISVESEAPNTTVDTTQVISKDTTTSIETSNTASLETDNTATRTKVVDHLPGVAVISDGSDSEPEQRSHRRGTYHIQKKRSSVAKNLAMQQDMDVVDSAPESSVVKTSVPVVIKPKPGPAVFDPIRSVYG